MPLAEKFTVLKFGGSLVSNARVLLAEVREWGETCLVVPGGGPFADSARDMQAHHGLSDDAAHWMALAGCEQYAHLLADIGKLDLTGDLAVRDGPAVLAPYRLMRERDPLPHTWDAASDCVAAWCASELDARFIKVTDVDGVILDGRLAEKIDASQLLVLPPTCLDALLPGYLLKWRLDLLVVGCDPDVLGGALRGEKSRGTLVCGR